MTYAQLLDEVQSHIEDGGDPSELAVKIGELARDHFQPRGESLALIPVASAAPIARSSDVAKVFAHYRRYKPRAYPLPSPSYNPPETKESRRIKELLRTGYSVESLCRCIDGYFGSPFHRGENERQTEYLAMNLMLRDASHVEAGIAMANGTKHVLTTREMKGARAVEAWAKGGK